MTARVEPSPLPQASAGVAAGLSLTALDRAPAFAQKRELTFLSWNHFVPASDDELRKQAEAFGKQAGVTVRVDTIAHLQLPAKRAAEAQSQSGHDMLLTGGADPFLYENQLADVGDLVDELGKKYGGWYPFAAESCADQVGLAGRARGSGSRSPATYNMAHFKKAGLEYPKTLGRAAPARQDPQEAGQPGRHRHQPLRATPTPRSGRCCGATAARCSRPTARRRRSTPTRPPR